MVRVMNRLDEVEWLVRQKITAREPRAKGWTIKVEWLSVSH
jgi:hypothetical protein